MDDLPLAFYDNIMLGSGSVELLCHLSGNVGTVAEEHFEKQFMAVVQFTDEFYWKVDYYNFYKETSDPEMQEDVGSNKFLKRVYYTVLPSTQNHVRLSKQATSIFEAIIKITKSWTIDVIIDGWSNRFAKCLNLVKGCVNTLYVTAESPDVRKLNFHHVIKKTSHSCIVIKKPTNILDLWMVDPESFAHRTVVCSNSTKAAVLVDHVDEFPDAYFVHNNGMSVLYHPYVQHKVGLQNLNFTDGSISSGVKYFFC